MDLSPELPRFLLPSIHSCCDVGTIGNVGLNDVYYGLTRLNGTMTFDILHRFTCAWTDGIGAAGLHVQRLDMGIYAKFRSKPFNKDGCHENMVECAKEMCELFPSPSDLPWQLFYGRCARERGQYNSPSFGTDEHMFELHMDVCKEITSSTRGGGQRSHWALVEHRGAS